MQDRIPGRYLRDRIGRHIAFAQHLALILDLTDNGDEIGTGAFVRQAPHRLFLSRADIPGADKGPLAAWQPAALRRQMDAGTSVILDDLLLRQASGMKTVKKEIPEIIPYRRSETADINAVSAALPAQLLQDAVKTFDLDGNRSGEAL